MELHTIEIGLAGNLLKQEFKIYGQLATICEFCDESNIQLKTTIPKLKITRENDVFLLSTFAAFGYRDTQLLNLNLCRMYCHSIRISDIITGDGNAYSTELDGRPNGIVRNQI